MAFKSMSTPGSVAQGIVDGTVRTIGTSAVAEKVYAMDEIREIADTQSKDPAFNKTQEFKLNNVALKHMRWMGESRPGVPMQENMTWYLHIEDILQIGLLEHDTKGPGFSFETPTVVGQKQPWSVAQFLAALRKDTTQRLGLEEHGVKRLVCAAIEGSTDKLRLNAARKTSKHFDAGVKPPIWDFLLTRGDGEVFSLHPSYKGYGVKTSNHTQGRGGDQGEEKMRVFLTRTYGGRAHGYYEEGTDLVRDEHRRRHLEEMRKGEKGKGEKGKGEQGQGEQGKGDKGKGCGQASSTVVGQAPPPPPSQKPTLPPPPTRLVPNTPQDSRSQVAQSQQSQPIVAQVDALKKAATVAMQPFSMEKAARPKPQPSHPIVAQC